MTGTYSYDAFGAVRAQTGVTTEWSYTGEQNDPTGLEYLRARYYDPATGRFLSQDPLPLLQRYPYANANPANYIDPSGYASQSTNEAARVLERSGDYLGARILRDPCWLIHMKCPHPPYNWKKIGAYARECVVWGASGAISGAFVGGGLGGAVGGAAVGCAAGMLAYYMNDYMKGEGWFDNTVVQCGVWGVGAGLIATLGRNPSLGASAVATLGGCVAGSLSWNETYFHVSEKLGVNNAVSQCGPWAGSAAIFGGPSIPNRLGFALVGCGAGFLSTLPPQ